MEITYRISCDMLDIAVFLVLIMKQQTQKACVALWVCWAHITLPSKVSMASMQTPSPSPSTGQKTVIPVSPQQHNSKEKLQFNS